MTLKTMLNKVPQITLFFWIIKVLSTTVGETLADFLATKLGLGLIVTSWVISGLFLIALAIGKELGVELRPGMVPRSEGGQRRILRRRSL